MVTLHDNQPVPKVIDFGVSKAISQQLTEKTLFTAYGQMVGTPIYMSPEQAQMSGLDVDTRSDIYSLGVVLYELLTGSTPLDAEKLRKSGYAEMQRLIREQEAPKPSQRVSTQAGEAQAKIARKRGTDPRQLGNQIRGDLDWIVMKALEKDRNRRYDTANGLASDIDRFLSGDPVAACPPSRIYLLRKLARKHKAPLAAVACVAAALIIGTGVSTWMAIRATRAQELANDRLEQLTQTIEQESKARKRASENARRAGENAERAQRNLERADEVVTRFVTEIGRADGPLARRAATRPLRKKLLEMGRNYYQKLIADNPEAGLSPRIANANFNLAVVLAELSGDKQEAIAAYQSALQTWQQLAREYPNRMEYRDTLASTYNNLGILYRTTGKAKRALASYQHALKIRRDLATDYPASSPNRRELAAIYDNIGVVYQTTGRPADALAAHLQALELHEQLVRQNPGNTRHQAALADNHNNLANLYGATGRFEKALASHRESLAIHDRLAKENPNNELHQIGQALAFSNIGGLNQQFGRSKDALTAYRQALEIRERLARDNPAVADHRNHLASLHNNIGEVFRTTGRPSDAMTEYQQSLKIRERLALENPAVTEYRHGLGMIHNNIGLLNKETGQPGKALIAYRKSLQIRRQLVRDNPAIADYRFHLAIAHNNLGELHRESQRLDEALAAHQKAAQIRERLVKQQPDHPDYRHDLATSYDNLALVYRLSKKPDTALKFHRQAQDILSRLVHKTPVMRESLRVLAGSHFNAGALLQETARSDEAVEHLGRAIPILTRLLAKRPPHPTTRLILKSAHILRAEAYGSMKQHRDAAKDWRTALALGTPQDAAYLRHKLCLALAGSGQHTEAAELGMTLLKSPLPANALFELACGFAICANAASRDARLNAEDRERLAQRSRRQAIVILDGLRRSSKCFDDDTHQMRLLTAPGLAGLRDREDFRALARSIGIRLPVRAVKP